MQKIETKVMKIFLKIVEVEKKCKKFRQNMKKKQLQKMGRSFEKQEKR